MVCFVVLHYLAYDETVKCVESIMDNLTYKKKKIIVVDNGSNNHTGRKLEKKFFDNDMVDVLINKKNLGFAQGNNVGYKYAIEKYHPEFVIVINNDIEIIQKDFIECILQLYAETEFAVLGPDIYSTAKHQHQSPQANKMIGEKKLLLKLLLWKLQSFLPQLVLIKRKIEAWKNKKIKKNSINYEIRHKNVPLQGSCFIFSKSFIQQRKEAFNPGTFMFGESEILCCECNQMGLTQIYDPIIQVLHHEDAATNMEMKSEVKKIKFKGTHSVESGKVLLTALKKSGKGDIK